MLSVTMSLYSIGSGIYYVYKKGNDIKKDYEEYKKYKRKQISKEEENGNNLLDKNNEIKDFIKID